MNGANGSSATKAVRPTQVAGDRSGSEIVNDGVKFTLTVTAESWPHFTAFAIDHLRERGYSVTEPGVLRWETPQQFRARLGLNQKTLANCLEIWPSRSTDQVFVDRRGESGRMKRLQSNAAFDEFCRREKERR